MIYILNYCPCVFLKQWYMPFCAFFTAFTVVMTILIVSTDLKVGRHYIRFNASYLWEFEGIAQENPYLSSLISKTYLQSPIPSDVTNNFQTKPSLQIFNIFRKKKTGVFVECGSDGGGDTEWLERVLGWHGLLTQPQPDKFEKLLTAQRSRAHLAHVCISPTIYPKHAYFKTNESLEAVPCFPLYSLMQAYNTTHLDLLSFVDVTAPVQVLKTLPTRKVRIKVITIKNSDPEVEEDATDLCCEPELTSLLDRWGYKSMSSCQSFQPSCVFACARPYCPMLTGP